MTDSHGDDLKPRAFILVKIPTTFQCQLLDLSAYRPASLQLPRRLPILIALLHNDLIHSLHRPNDLNIFLLPLQNIPRMPLHREILLIPRPRKRSQLLIRSSIDHSSNMRPVQRGYSPSANIPSPNPIPNLPTPRLISPHLPEHIAQGSQVDTNVHLQRNSFE